MPGLAKGRRRTESLAQFATASLGCRAVDAEKFLAKEVECGEPFLERAFQRVLIGSQFQRPPLDGRRGPAPRRFASAAEALVMRLDGVRQVGRVFRLRRGRHQALGKKC